MPSGLAHFGARNQTDYVTIYDCISLSIILCPDKICGSALKNITLADAQQGDQIELNRNLFQYRQENSEQFTCRLGGTDDTPSGYL